MMMTPSRHVLSLTEANCLVRDLIEMELNDSYWIEAEIAELNERGGHCYLTLIEKNDLSHTQTARAGARCWRQRWERVKLQFEQVASTRLQPGMKILMQAHPQFHENYGFAWIIDHIDPTFTLGELARRRQAIIAQLKKEGVFDLNKQQHLSPFAQRIAVVSSATAAGYGDFVSQLTGNAHGFAFQVELFPAVMQGEQTEESIIRALDMINDDIAAYDAVVIIRGGGSTADLTGFDTLRLAEHVANFPLPVITGIGHDRDECILDLIAHTRVKTPTAAAEALIANLHRTLTLITNAESRLHHVLQQRMEFERLRLARITATLPHTTRRATQRQATHINDLTVRLQTGIRRQLSAQQHRIVLLDQQARNAAQRLLQRGQHRLALLDTQLQALDPQRLLNKGYSITLHDGRAVRDASQLREGDRLTTRTAKGIINSIVTN